MEIELNYNTERATFSGKFAISIKVNSFPCSNFMKPFSLFLFFAVFLFCQNAPAQNAAAKTLDGCWYLTFDLPDSLYSAAFSFKTDEAGAVKTATLSEPNVYLTGGALDGNDLKLNGKSAFGDVVIKAQYDGEKISGKWSVGFVGGEVSGVREPVGKRKTDYLQVFEQTWKTVNDKFYDPKFNGVDWKTVGTTYRARIAKATDDAEFMNAMREMLKELKVSHVGFYYSPFENEFKPKKQPVQNPAPLQSVVWKKLAPEIGYMQIKQFTESAEAVAEIDKAFAEIGDAPNLIVDLRGNGGGTLSMAIRLGDYLYPKTTYVGFFASRQGLTRFKTDSMDALKPEKLPVYSGYRLEEFWAAVEKDGAVMIASGGRAKHYRGKIVFLIDERCGSTTEGFLAVVKEMKLGTLVGRKTRGVVLSAVSEKTAGDWLVKYPKADYRTPQGKRIEGIGVEPDITVDKGKELERALEILKNPSN